MKFKVRDLLKYLEWLKIIKNPKIKQVKNQIYQDIFHSPQGREVLIDLMRHCKFGADVTNSKDVQKMMYDLGKQAVINFILAKL